MTDNQDREQKTITCDVAVIGGSFGGVAALIQLRDVDDVALTCETDVVGGQVTSQLVPALDEHDHIETFCSRKYAEFRQHIRKLYQNPMIYNAPGVMEKSVLGSNMPLNPGNGWVSRLCFMPDIGEAALEETHYQYWGFANRVLYDRYPVAATMDDQTITSVNVWGEEQTRIEAFYYLDATDLGDLLPLTKTAYTTGAEAKSDTGEPQAADEARPNETQGFTFCFAVEYRVGEDHTIEKPKGYEYFREKQPYTLSPIGRDGNPVVYKMFENSEQGNLPFWTYRRLHDGELLGGNDISLINWISNDYHGGNIIDATPQDREKYLNEARHLSLGFLYWLQTECPRDDGGFGYPELKLRPDLMGTKDGLAQMPYIRESRRIVSLQRVVEQDITAEFNKGARARHFSNSVGLGWYAMDLHPCVGNPDVSMYAPTKPFQIPLGALIPRDTKNLIASCKNIGTTHLTNGAYRVHPTEWAIGEAAGTLASFCIQNDSTPHAVFADEWQTWRLQYQLVQRGCPIFWAIDIPTEHPYFEVTQLLLVRDIIIPESSRWHTLEIGLDQPLGDDFDLVQLKHIADELNTRGQAQIADVTTITSDITWSTLCDLFKDLVKVLA